MQWFPKFRLGGLATAILLLLLILVGQIVTRETSVLGQEASKTSKPPIEEFEKYLSNSILSGSFTMDGQPLNKLEEERYEIKSAKNLKAMTISGRSKPASSMGIKT